MKNVTPKTLAWYEQSFRAFDGALADEASMKRRVVELRSRGISPVSVNTWLRCINAYLKWTGASFKIPRLQEGKKLLSTLTQDHIQRIAAYKPPKSMWRTHVAVLLLLDCGLRISDLRNLRYQQVDLGNLALRIKGKGRKERLVPISTEMRRRLYQYINKRLGPPTYLFATRTGNGVTVRNFQRDMWQLGKHLHITDIRFSPHTLRHSFAVSYLKAGGNLEYLRRILGHSSLLITQKYLGSLDVEDLADVHNDYSPISPTQRRSR